MLLVKGTAVSFILRNGRRIEPPRSHGMMHDVDGPGPKMLPRTTFLVGPFKRGGIAPERMISWETSKYMGDYDTKIGEVELPDRTDRFSADRWTFVGLVRRVIYRRTGELAFDMKHDFKDKMFFVVPVETRLYRLGRWLRLDLPALARINERAIISP